MGRNFLALGLGEAGARLVAFGATVYLARTLGAAGYGVIGAATAALLYCSYIADAGVEALGTREVAGARDVLEQLVPPVLAGRIALATILAAFVIVIGLTVVTQPDGAVLAVYALTLLPLAANTRWVFLGLEDAAPTALARISGESLMVLLVVGLVHGIGDLAKVPLAQLAGDLLGAMVLAILLRNRGLPSRLRWTPAVARPFFGRSWHLAAHAVLGLLIYNSDLLFLRALRPPAETGFYAAAYTLISFLLNMGVAYGQSLLPTLSRLRGEQARIGLYHSATSQMFAAGLALAVGGSLLAGGIMNTVFGSGYRPAVPALAILLWSIPVAYLRTAPQAALIVEGRQELLARFTAVVALVNLGLNLLLIPRWGIIGAAGATLGTEILRTATAHWFARGLGYPLTPLRRFVRSIAAALAMGLALIWRSSAPIWWAIPLGALVFTAALTLVGGVRWRSQGPPEIRL